MECKNGKDAPPFLAHALILSGQALETGLKPRYYNKQRQRAVNNHPSWDRNQKYKPRIELKKFSVACVSRYKYSMSNTYDFSQSTDLSCIFVFNMWRSFLCIFFPLHFLSFFIFLGFSPFLFFLEHHLWVLRPLLEKKLNKRVNRSFASTQFNLFHFSFNKSLWAIKNTFIWLLKI